MTKRALTLWTASIACLFLIIHPALAQLACTPATLQEGTPANARGIILTAFDRTGIWVYDVVSGRRYPLPDTAPCVSNCHLSPDARWVSYFNPETNAFNKMRLDGTERTFLAANAEEVRWWSADTLLVWTPAGRAYLRPETADERTHLPSLSLTNVQPGGERGVVVNTFDSVGQRQLVSFEAGNIPQVLGEATPYYDATMWSPDGRWLAYILPQRDQAGFITGIQVLGLRADDPTQPITWVTLDAGTALRVGGLRPDGLSWSPDSARLAFWVVGLDGLARLNLFDVNTGANMQYCEITTAAHTPNPPRLVWSPDSAYVAFAHDIPEDERGALVLAFDPAAAIYHVLSEGVYPALGAPEIAVWGYGPNDG